MKHAIIFLLSVAILSVNAQVVQNFEPVNGNANVRSIMQGQCWRVIGWNNSIGVVPPINGTQSLVSGNGASATSLSGLATPYLNMSGHDSLAFTYQWYGSNIPQNRWFRILTMDLNGILTLHDSVLIDNSNNSPIFYSFVISGITGQNRVYINYRGNAGTGRFGIDDYFVSASFVYPNGCFNRDTDNRNDIQDRDDDNDGIEDFVEICGPGSTTFACVSGIDPSRDSDNDGVINFHDANYCTLNSKGVCTAIDIDGDGVINSMDLDSDGDGILDALEANGGNAPGSYQNGIITGFTGGNGMPDNSETAPNSGITTLPLVDSDGDGIPDFRESDADNDGIPDNIEAQTTAGFIAPSGLDVDFDGVDDVYDGIMGPGANGLVPVNSEASGLPDYLDTDSDDDGLSDALEAHDLNANGSLDAGELPFVISGTDTDNDGLDNVWDAVTGYSINSGYTPQSFPNAAFGSSERDWREPNIFGAEICNNGIDDDGDGLTDCQDNDCVVPSIVNVISNPATCGNSNDGSIQIIAVNAANYSINNGSSFSTQSSFSSLSAGIYQVVVSGTGGCTASFAGNPVSVSSGNCAPVAFDDSYVTDEDQVLIGGSVLLNDNATDGPGLDVNTTPITNPSNGVLTLNSDGSFLYSPNADFNGSDSFTVQVCDGATPALCDISLVSITVNAVNDLPVINNENINTNQNTPVGGNILINDTDVEGPLTSGTIALFGPLNGNININALGVFTYTPNPSFQGVDTVVVQVCDNDGACGNDTLFITVIGVNTPPVINNETISTNENTAVSGNILTNDSDAEGPLSSGTSALFGPLNGNITINALGVFTYTPNPSFQGVDTVVVQVCDNDGACGNDTLFITVIGVNTPPVINNETISTNENTAVSGNILTNDSDAEGPLSSGTTALFGPLNGNININALGVFTYTPNPSFQGVDTVVFQVCDNDGACGNDTLFITVIGVNTPPVINNETISTNENTAVSGNILTNDSDAEGPLSSGTTALFGPLNGNISINALGVFTYTPNPSFQGVDTVVFQVCDNDGACGNDTLFITVIGVNSPPVINNENFTTPEETLLNGNITTNDSDDSGILIVNTTPVQAPSNGVIFMNAQGNFSYTPFLNFNGTDTMLFQVCDNDGVCGIDTLFILVTPLNDPGLVIDEVITTPEDQSVSGNILSNDADADGLLSVQIPVIQTTQNGLITMLPNGDFSYTPTLNFFGIDTCVTLVCDPLGNCLPDTLFINVSPVDDAAQIDNENSTVLEDGLLSLNVLLNDSDPDGSLSAGVGLVYGPLFGLASVTPSGDLTYTPQSNYFGADTIVITVCDVFLNCVNDTVFILVTPVNDLPQINNEFFNINQGVTLNANLLTNDNDPEGPLNATVVPVFGPLNGNINIQISGDFQYVPNAGFAGIDTIVVLVCDNDGACGNDTIFIQVGTFNQSPVVLNESIFTDEDNPVNGNVLNNDTDPDGTLSALVSPVAGAANGVFNMNSTGDFTYQPNSNFFGLDSVVVSVCDNGGICINDTIFFTVNPVNDIPLVLNDVITVDEDTPFSGNLLSNDNDAADGGVLIANSSVVSGPFHGIILVNSNGTFTYIPNPAYNGPDTVVAEVCDNGVPLPGICILDTLFIQVQSINDAPVTVFQSVSLVEDNSISGSMLNGDSDPEGTVLSYSTTPVMSPDFGIASIDSVGNFNYVPLPNFNGSDTLVVQVCDNGIPLPALCSFDTIVFVVSAVNDAPLTGGDTASVMGGFTVSGDIMTNNSDPFEGTPLSANPVPVSGPANGSIIINSNGTYTYTADSTFSGTDTIIVQICDTGLPLPPACTNDTLIITVNPAPFLASAGQDADVCDTLYVMQGNVPNLGSGLWSTVSGFGTPVDATLANTQMNGLALGQNVFVWTLTYNNIVSYDTVIITVVQPPSPAFAGFDQDVCGNSVTLQAVAPVIGSGNWTILNGSGVITFPGNPGTPVTSLGLGENRFIWQVTNSVCPASFDTVLIRTFTNPSNADAGDDLQVCSVATQLNAATPAVGFGSWRLLSGYGTIDSSLAPDAEVYDLIPGESVFIWSVSNGPCVATFDTLKIVRYQVPDSAFAGSDTTVCATEYRLNARAVNVGVGSWIGSGSFSPDVLSSNALVSGLQPGINILIWVVSNGVCPEFRDEMQIDVVLCDTALFIPEGFSPNGDGVNDQFVISGAKGKKVSISVFNRWGSLVYESGDYQNNWDGSSSVGFSPGNQLTEGTYYYVAEIEGMEARKGYLTLWK